MMNEIDIAFNDWAKSEMDKGAANLHAYTTKRGFTAGYEAHVKKSGWTKTEEAPNEWKDGRPLNVWNNDFHEVEADYKFNSDGILCDDFWHPVDLENEEITHVSLPLEPPARE